MSNRKIWLGGTAVVLILALMLGLLLLPKKRDASDLVVPDSVSVVRGISPLPVPGGQPDTDVHPGYYCQSAYSSTARTQCATAGGVGMEARWFWCQLVDNSRVYDFSPIENWVVANHAAGLRSIVAMVTKDLRTDTAGLSGPSCTEQSDGTPSWMLATAPYNNDINGVSALPLENPAGRPHLNYLDTQAKAEIRNLVQRTNSWLQSFKQRNPSAYASIEAIETMFGEQDTGAGMPKSWYPYADRPMYRCRYGGGVWTPNSSGSEGTCSVANPNYDAAANWRDKFSKPLLDEWGVVAPDKPKFMVVSNVLADAGIERTEACAGCGGRNLIDYAYDLYGIGAMTTGGGMDGFNGNGRDTAGYEYINAWNVMKMRWRDRLIASESGAVGGLDPGAPGCCDTSAEVYWNGLQGIDYGAKYTFLTAGKLYNFRDNGALLSIKEFRANTVDMPDYRYSRQVSIYFRDTDGTYYPDGDNGTAGLPNAPRGEYPCCAYNPNYEWLLYQDNPHKSQVVRLGRDTLPNDDRSVWARRTTATYPTFKFTVDPEWYPATASICTTFEVSVVYYDKGSDSWAFIYPSVHGTPVGKSFAKTNTDAWKIQRFTVYDWSLINMLSVGGELSNFFVQDNGDGVDTFHLIHVKDVGDCMPGPAATPTPLPVLPICTVTPVPTRGIEAINTPTPTPTHTP